MATLNIAGLTLSKLFLLLENHRPDVLCLQETWLTPGALPPSAAGYTLLEQRRDTTSRGGIALYVRKGLQILTSATTEYAIWA